MAIQLIQGLILHSHDHSGTVRYGSERFSTVMVLCVDEYRTILNHTGPARLLLLCCMVRYSTVEQKCAESHTILAILGTTWSTNMRGIVVSPGLLADMNHVLTNYS